MQSWLIDLQNNIETCLRDFTSILCKILATVNKSQVKAKKSDIINKTDLV